MWHMQTGPTAGHPQSKRELLSTVFVRSSSCHHAAIFEDDLNEGKKKEKSNHFRGTGGDSLSMTLVGKVSSTWFIRQGEKIASAMLL